MGTVHELGLFGTTIVTPDNVHTLVGNGKIFGDTIQNFSPAAGAARRARGFNLPRASIRSMRSIA